MQESLWWFFVNILFIVMLGFFSMMEMAFVSFNKLRLQYYVSKNNKRAIWINYLLQHSSYLFGTTLIGVNVALIVGSECSRQLYASLGFNPDLAPLTQVIIVVIFAELAPMFAARRYAERVSMMGVPIIYGTAKLITPLLYVVGGIAKISNILFRTAETKTDVFPTQEELQKMLQEQDEDKGRDEDFNLMVSQIFRLRTMEAKQLMDPLEAVQMLPSNCTVAHAREMSKKEMQPYFLIFHRDRANIIGILSLRDLIRAPDLKRVRDYARAPWFITQHVSVLQILKQFRHNNQTVAVILDDKGMGKGVLTLEDIIEELFGTIDNVARQSKASAVSNLLIVERTLPGNMPMAKFMEQFSISEEALDPLVEHVEDMTLSQYFINALGHHPEEGDSLYIDPFELTVKETSLIDVKSVIIRTKVK